MRYCCDASAPVYVEADQSHRALGGLARVDSHPHAHAAAFGPGMGGKPSLDLNRGGQALARRCEHREERIALGVHLAAVVDGERGPHQSVVISQHSTVGIAKALQHCCRALDVGEEKGKRLRCNKLGDPVAPAPLNSAVTGFGGICADVAAPKFVPWLSCCGALDTDSARRSVCPQGAYQGGERAFSGEGNLWARCRHGSGRSFV